MMGACDVLALTSSMILEEGFPIEELRRIQASMQVACREAGAKILAGDTKVMGRGEIDRLVTSTTGLGVTDRVVRDAGLRPDDAIVMTGTIGDHGLCVMSVRHGLGLEGELSSDVAPINGLVRAALDAGGDAIHAMKDPTRGGVTSALSEMAEKAGVGIVLDEAALPMTDAARAAAELLGIDPLGVANEGKALIGVRPDALDRVLAALRAHPLGARATCIGRAVDAPHRRRAPRHRIRSSPPLRARRRAAPADLLRDTCTRPRSSTRSSIRSTRPWLPIPRASCASFACASASSRASSRSSFARHSRCSASREGTSRATLELVHEEAVWSCASCATRVPRGSVLRCEACGGERGARVRW